MASEFGPGNDMVITISELTGELRQIRLSGRCLPNAPLEEPMEQAVKIIRYAGAVEKTIQVLGFDPKDADWKGKWDASFMYGDPYFQYNDNNTGGFTHIRSAAQARKIAGGMLKQGQLLEVLYGPEGVETRVRGILSRAKFLLHNFVTIEWEMHFDWQSDTTVNAAPSVTQSAPDATGWSEDMQNLIGDLEGAMAFVDNAYRTGLNDALGVLNTMLDLINDVVDFAVSLATLPARAARDIADMCAKVLGTFDDLKEKFLSIGAAYGTAQDAWDRLGSSDVSDEAPAMRAGQREAAGANRADYEVAAVDAAQAFEESVRVVRARCRELAAQAAAYLAPKIKAIYQVQPGDSLYSIAAAFFAGNVDRWMDIADANGLESDSLFGVVALIIPEVT